MPSTLWVASYVQFTLQCTDCVRQYQAEFGVQNTVAHTVERLEALEYQIGFREGLSTITDQMFT